MKQLHVLSAALGVVLLSSGCSGGSPASDSLRTAADGGAADLAAQAAGAATATGTTAAVGAPSDPLAPETYRPVVRSGEKAGPRVAAPGGRFTADAPVRYPDGIVVRVERVTRRTETEIGTGSFPGRPQTAFHLRFENGSAKAVDLSQTVVTTTYGTQVRTAAPVYSHPQAQDFSGVVAPGATATATYVFSIPPGQARTARTIVDFDGAHAPATLLDLAER